MDREKAMQHWDMWREYIANGGKGSMPRDGFESYLDRIEELKSALEKVKTAISEAEYAMVGGNDIKEDIPWETADGWFREIDQALEGKE